MKSDEVDETILKGRENFKAWYDQHQAERTKPEMDKMIRAWLKLMPPEIKAQLEQMNPKAMADVQKRFGGD